MTELDLFRSKIDIIDEQMIKLLAARYDICRDVAVYKKRQKIPMMQPARINSIITRLSEISTSYGIPAELIHKIFKDIINYSCELENKIMDKG